MAGLASIIIWAFALQCIVPASSETNCTMTVARTVCALPLDYWQQSDKVRKSRTDTFITISLTIYTDGPSIDCGELQRFDKLYVRKNSKPFGEYKKYGNIVDHTEDKNGPLNTVSFKINAEDLLKNLTGKPNDVFDLSYSPCGTSVFCYSPKFSLKNDFPSSIRVERVEQSSDQLVNFNSSVPSSVLRNGTQVAVWQEYAFGILAFNLNVSDEDVYKENQNQFEYSAITCHNVTFSVLVQFCNTLDSHQQETVADVDALSVERPLGTRSASCQQLAWCAQVNSTEDRNRALMQYSWNVTELFSAVQKLYNQCDLSNRPFALVFVTMEASATSGTVNPLNSSQQVVWAVRLPQRLRAAVVGKAAANSNVKAETPAVIAVVLCVMRAVYEQLATYH